MDFPLPRLNYPLLLTKFPISKQQKPILSPQQGNSNVKELDNYLAPFHYVTVPTDIYFGYGFSQPACNYLFVQ